MTGREKIEAAFSAQGTAEIPAVICYEDIYVRDHWDELTSRPWWHQFSPDLDHQLAWRRDVMAATPQDWFCLPACPSRDEREAAFIEERTGGVFRIDRRSGREERLTRPVVGGWDSAGISGSVSPPRLPERVEQVDASIPPAGEFDAEEFIAAGHSDLAAALLAEFGESVFGFAHVSSPLWCCYGLWGFEGMMTLIADRPDLVGRACGHHLAWSIQSARQAAALGASAVWLEECLTDAISPGAFEALNVPFLRRLIGEIRSLGMKSIYYYCGSPAGKWEHILSLGMDALSLEEGKKGFTIEIEEVVRRVAGRCTVLGNLDAIGLLGSASEERLRAEIARQVAAGRKNRSRFIMSLGSPVTPGTSAERVRLYCRLAHDLGAA